MAMASMIPMMMIEMATTRYLILLSLETATMMGVITLTNFLTKTKDSDKDGIGDNADADRDGDSYADDEFRMTLTSGR